LGYAPYAVAFHDAALPFAAEVAAKLREALRRLPGERQDTAAAIGSSHQYPCDPLAGCRRQSAMDFRQH